MPNVTLRQIAVRAGVSVGTVSLSLRDSPRITPETRRHVLEVARSMGYESDPRVAEFMSFLRRKKPRGAPPVLAMLMGKTPAQAAARPPEPRHEVCMREARRRATELGYQVEVFNVGEARDPAYTPARLQTILLTRAIRGILLPPVGVVHPVLPRELDHFCFAESMDREVPPYFACVQSAIFQNTLLAMTEIHRAGHERVGVFVGGNLLVPETIAAYRHSAIEFGWPLLTPHHRPDYNTDELAAWIAREKPSVIYTNFPDLYHQLFALGFQIPRDLSFVLNEVPHHRLPVNPSGIDDEPERVFAGMVDLLVSQLNHGQFGVPAVRPRTELIGRWHPGDTLVALKRKAPASRSVRKT
jgi:DNA-binding LacI/PurR family transcriptional regulator